MDQSNDNKDMSLEELLDEVTGEEQPPAKESPAPRGRTKIRSVETSEEPMPGRVNVPSGQKAPEPDNKPPQFSDNLPKIRRMSDSTRARELAKIKKKNARNAGKKKPPVKKETHEPAEGYTYEKERPEGEYAYTQIHGAKRAQKRKKVRRTPDLTAAGTETIHLNIKDIVPVAQVPEPDPVQPVDVEPAPRAAHTSLDLTQPLNVADAAALDIRIRKSKEEAAAETERRRQEISDRMNLESSQDIRSDIAELKSAMSFRVFALAAYLAIGLLLIVGSFLGWSWAADMPAVMRAFVELLLAAGTVGVCTPVLRNGLTRLIRFRADTDSVAAVALVGSAAVCVSNVFTSIFTHETRPCFLPCVIFTLLLHSVGKLLIVSRELTNLRFASRRFNCYGLTIVEEEMRADAFTRGVLADYPILATMRHTNSLIDFRKYTYSADLADRFCRGIAPVTTIAALAVSIILTALRGDTPAYFLHLFSMFTTAASCAAITFVVNLPLLKAARRMVRHGALLLGYQSVDDFYDTNAVMIDAASFFPEGSVRIAGVKMFVGGKTREVLLSAASLAHCAGSVFASAFHDVLQDQEIPYAPVDNYVYEDSMGLSGWIHSQRVLLGNRELMKAHNIEGLPSRQRESEMVGSNQEAVYLSVSGSLAAMFLIELTADAQVEFCAKKAIRHDICLVLRSVDPMITIDKMSRLFGIPKDTIKIIPARMHPDYYTETAPVEQLSASMACTGSFVSVAQLVIGAKVLRKAGMFGVFIQAVGALLMLGLVVLEAFLHLGLTPGMMLLLETIISLITILAVNIRRTF